MRRTRPKRFALTAGSVEVTEAGSAVPNELSKKSIAVLPFQNLSEEKQSEYFADGVQDQVLTDLAKVADLEVISRSSVLQYKPGVARNLRESGRELGLRYLLEGTVQRSGGKVRVNAQLVSTASDAHVWAETYDRNLADVFAIQSEIATAIASQLQARLSPNERQQLQQAPTTDLAAFDLYSQAKSLMLTASFSATNEADVRKAIELLDEAVKRDPSFFDAYCDPAPPRCRGDAPRAGAVSLLRTARLCRRARGINNRARRLAERSASARARGLHSAPARPGGGSAAGTPARGRTGPAELFHPATNRGQLPISEPLRRGQRPAGSRSQHRARQRRDAEPARGQSTLLAGKHSAAPPDDRLRPRPRTGSHHAHCR